MIKDINIIAPVTTQTSYGLCSLYLASELNKHIKVNLIPIGQPELHPYFAATEKMLHNGKFFSRGPTIRIFHQFSQDLFCGEPHIGFPIFELDGFNEVEKHHLSQLDMVFVTSEWAKKIVEPHNKNIYIVNLGVDLNLFSPQKHKSPRPIFLHVGKVEVRKHSKEIVDLFAQEFKNDDVELWLAWDNIFIGKEQEEWNNYAYKKLGDKVRILPRFNDFREISGLMKHVNYFISLSSAEGWNMPLLEAMATGLPCIATNCTAQTEFINNNNCLSIVPTAMEYAYDGMFFKDREHRWAKIDNSCQDQFKKHLRSLLGLNNNVAGIETARKFTWENSARQILEAMKHI